MIFGSAVQKRLGHTFPMQGGKRTSLKKRGLGHLSMEPQRCPRSLSALLVAHAPAPLFTELGNQLDGVLQPWGTRGSVASIWLRGACSCHRHVRGPLTRDISLWHC